MNRKQKVALWVGLVAVVCMGLIPPWVYTRSMQGALRERPAGYYSIFNPPRPFSALLGVRLDISRLLIQWALVAMTTATLVVSLKGRTGNPRGGQPTTASVQSGESTWFKPKSDALQEDLERLPPPLPSGEKDTSDSPSSRPAQRDTISELLRLKHASEAAEADAPVQETQKQRTPPTISPQPPVDLQSNPPDASSDSAICPYCGAERGSVEWKPVYGLFVCPTCQRAFSSGRRRAAMVDFLLLFVVAGVLGLLAAAFNQAFAFQTPNSEENAGQIAAGAAWILFLSKDAFRGQSVGKRLFGLQVVDVRTARPIGVGASFLRNLPLFIPLLWVIAYYQLDRGKRLGDGWAHTAVIWKKRLPKQAQPSLSSTRGIASATAESTTARSPELPTRWLGFWTCFRLPVGGLLNVIGGYLCIEPGMPASAILGAVVSIAIGVGAVGVALGLRRGQLWAWKYNWFFVFGEPVWWVFGRLEGRPTVAEAVGEYIGLLLGLGLLWGIWSWPNYVYFKKRRHLFR